MQWLTYPKDTDKVNRLQSELGINKVLCEILVNRGIDNFVKAKQFFRPDITMLHSPFLMKDMEKAIERINLAISRQEKIMLYGDYDVDGTMSVSVLYNFLKQKYPNLIYYIPHRFREGYGVSMQGIEYAHKEGVGLLITVDCGIRDINTLALAKNYNIDTIICDHHTPGDSLPDAMAILNPKQTGCKYPFKELCGCGIVFKLICAWSIKEYGSLDMALPYLDLVAIATAADVVPLIDENRVILALGLRKINNRDNVLLSKLIDTTSFYKKELTSTDVSFVIAPRINAVGRLSDGVKVVDLFTQDLKEEVDELLQKVNSYNTERKKLDHAYTDEAISMLQSYPNVSERHSTVLYNPHWHKGVIGIVASRVMEVYYKPTLICTLSDDKISCSARSVKGFDVLAALDECEELFTNYGGHFYAAGVNMIPENFEKFVEKFEMVVSSQIQPDMLIPKMMIDAEISLQDISPKFYDILHQMAPFGNGNTAPILALRGVKVLQESIKIYQGKHLSLTISQGQHKMKCIGFGKSDMRAIVENSQSIDLAIQLLQNTYNGRTSIEGQILDIKLSGDQ